MAQAPRFLRQEHDTQYGIKDQNTNLFWFVYGYPKPKMTYYFNDELIEPGGRFDMSYTRNGQATLFINKYVPCANCLTAMGVMPQLTVPMLLGRSIPWLIFSSVNMYNYYDIFFVGCWTET